MTPFSTETMGAWGGADSSTFYMVEIISLETQPAVVAICSSLLKVLHNSSWKNLLQTKDSVSRSES